MDNDAYGHVNNVVYYAVRHGGQRLPDRGRRAGHPRRRGDRLLVIETRCNHFAPLAFPQQFEAGLRVAHMGAAAVRYEVGLFAADAPLRAPAGHFIHVYVDRQTRRPVASPSAARRPATRA